MATSKSKQHKMTQPTVDWDHGAGALKATAEPKQYNLPYAEAKPKGKQFGMRITVDAFHQLLKGALQVHAGQKQSAVRFVEFSKASIFRVLSQPGCEYIRFYFVYPEKGKLSLVLEGLDADQKALKLESHVMAMGAAGKVRTADDDDPDYEEVGNGSEAGGGSGGSGGGSGGGGSTPFSEASTPRGAAAKKSAKAAEQAALTALLKAINTKGGE